MKKFLRVIAVFTITVLLCVSLSGCQALEDLKAHHAFYTEDKSIMWNGVEYILLPDSDTLKPPSDYETVYVTETDVPVLLSEAFGDHYDVYNGGMFLHPQMMYIDDYYLVQAYNHTYYYCRADQYETICAEIAKEQGDQLEYNYYSYICTEWDELVQDYQDKRYVLTDSQLEAIHKTVENADIPLYLNDYAYITMATIESHTADYLFYDYDQWDIGALEDIYGSSEEVSIKDYVVFDHSDNNYYIVPQELHPVFEEMLQPVLATLTEDAVASFN